MTRKLRNRSGVTIAALLIGLLALAFSAPANNVRAADNRSIYWQRWDVLIDNIDTTNNVFHVTETHYLQVVTGPFNGGDRDIPLNHVTAIDNGKITDGETVLSAQNATPKDCPKTLGIVCISTDVGANQYIMYYNFAQQAHDNEVRIITIEYDVHGALRSYPGGDQLDWNALADNRPALIKAATVTVKMPLNVHPQIAASYPTTWLIGNQGSVYAFIAPSNLGVAGNVEIRIQYPHNPMMSAPPWQKPFDPVTPLATSNATTQATSASNAGQ